MFNNRKERAELLEAVEVSNKDVTIPHFPWVRINKFSNPSYQINYIAKEKKNYIVTTSVNLITLTIVENPSEKWS